MENTWMCQLRTLALFQRQKSFSFCFFTFCLLAYPELLVAPAFLALLRSRKQSSAEAAPVWMLEFLLETICLRFFVFCFSPGGSKIFSWVQDYGGESVLSMGQFCSNSVLQRCPSNWTSAAHVQPWSDFKSCRWEYLDPEEQHGLKVSTGLQMTLLTPSCLQCLYIALGWRRVGSNAGDISILVSWLGMEAQPGSGHWEAQECYRIHSL